MTLVIASIVIDLVSKNYALAITWLVVLIQEAHIYQLERWNKDIKESRDYWTNRCIEETKLRQCLQERMVEFTESPKDTNVTNPNT